MFGMRAVFWVKLILRVSGFSGIKLAVVSANEAVITEKILFIVVIFYSDYAVTYKLQWYDYP